MKIITIVILWKAKLANQRCYKQLQTDSMSGFCAYSTQWAWSSFLTLQQCWGQYWSLILRRVLKRCFHIIIVEIEEENWSYWPYAVNQELLVITLKVIVGLEKQSFIFFFKTSLRVELEVDQVAVLDKGIASKAITWLCSEVVPPCSSFLLPSIS